MNSVRPLALFLEPVAGESFVSYIERLAARHRVPLVLMLYYLGLLNEEKYERLQGYGIVLSSKRLVLRLKREN